MHNAQAEALFERVEVKIAMQEGMVIADAIRLRIIDAVDEVDEDTGVDDDHELIGAPACPERSRRVGAHRVEIAFPSDLAAQRSEACLATRLNQQPQCFLNRRTLGRRL